MLQDIEIVHILFASPFDARTLRLVSTIRIFALSFAINPARLAMSVDFPDLLFAEEL